MMMIIAWSSDYCCILCRYFNEICSICLLHLLSTAVYSLCIVLWWRRGSDLRHGDVERLLRVEQRHVVVAVEPTLRLAFPASFLLPSVQSVHLSLVSQALKEFFLAVAPRLPRLLGSAVRRRLRWSRGVSVFASVRRLASFISCSLPLNAAVHHLWKTLWLIACLDVFNLRPCGVHHWPKTGSCQKRQSKLIGLSVVFPIVLLKLLLCVMQIYTTCICQHETSSIFLISLFNCQLLNFLNNWKWVVTHLLL